MSKILVKYSDDYADEFEIKGFAIMTEEEFKKGIDFAKEEFEEVGSLNFVFGSNEYIDYEDFEKFKNCFNCEKISEDNFTVLKQFFGIQYGIFPCWIFEESMEIW